MRLGQLSRQLDVSTDKIAKLLNDNFREVSSHPNVKLTDEELLFVQNQFPTETEALIVDIKASAPEVVEAPEVENESIVPETKETSTEASTETPAFVESLRPQVITLEDEFNAQKEDLELYKAEKPHLEGLKVVGKIELPEPVVKEKAKVEPKKEVSRTRDRKSNRGRRSNELSLVEQRKKEERLAKKRKYEEEQRQKELKRKHYEETVKAKLVKAAPKKKKKVVKEDTVHVAPTTSTVRKTSPAKKAAPKATNPIKRFWLWLNGAYDN